MFKISEDLVITIAVAAGLIIALALTIATVVWKVSFPPTITATFLAIALAALTYRFLGGVTGTQFSVGLLKLGGSAAFVVGLIWFVGDRLRDEQKLYSSSATYREQIDDLTGQLNQAQTTIAAKDQQLQDLRRRGGGGTPTRGTYTIEEIKKLSPDDPFIRNLKQLVAGQEGPFRTTLRDLRVRVAVIKTDSDMPRFNICEDTLGKLNEGVEVPSTRALFSRSAGENGEPVSITADRNGRIGADVCQAPDRQFDVQINCPIATKLFPDVIASCAEGIKVKGMAVSIGALAE